MKILREHAAAKSITGIVLILLIFSAIISNIGYKSFVDAIFSQYSDGAFRIAETAARLVDADKIGDYAESGGETEEYKKVWNQLDRLCNSSGSTFIYVITPDTTDYGHITFLFSTINKESSYSVYDFGYVRETTNDDYREKYRRLYEKESGQELVIRDKGYIETDPHITAMTSLKGSDGEVKGILCVQRQMDALVTARHTYLFKVILALAIFLPLVIIIQSIFLQYELLRPLKVISGEATRFSLENVTTGTKLKSVIRSRDEIGQLAGCIDDMEEQIQSYVENLTRVTAEKERISTELNVAKNIQAEMLPRIFPAFPERTEFDIFASMNPAREVGGDFYDFFLIDDDHLAMVIADVSGKGVPAALFMVIAMTLIKNQLLTDGGSPAEVLEKVNDRLCERNESELFVTVWLSVLEISTGRVLETNAGHEHPALKRKGGKYELEIYKHSPAVAVMEGVRFKEREFTLNPGDSIFVYTDGVVEAINTEENMYGTDRMLEVLNRDGDLSPRQILEGVKKSVDDYVGEAPQFDDLTMLCIEYKGRKE